MQFTTIISFVQQSTVQRLFFVRQVRNQGSHKRCGFRLQRLQTGTEHPIKWLNYLRIRFNNHYYGKIIINVENWQSTKTQTKKKKITQTKKANKNVNALISTITQNLRTISRINIYVILNLSVHQKKTMNSIKQHIIHVLFFRNDWSRLFLPGFPVPIFSKFSLHFVGRPGMPLRRLPAIFNQWDLKVQLGMANCRISRAHR